MKNFQSELEKLILEAAPKQEEIQARTAMIRDDLFTNSANITEPNFTKISGRDVERLFLTYDALFFNGLFESLLPGRIDFRVSSRMTSAGGMTTRRRQRNRPETARYDIAISSHLLFETFSGEERQVRVTGLECRDRVDALLRVMEHELVHLSELLVWDVSSCSRNPFQAIATRMFGHLEHTHQLVTRKEKAAKNGILPGVQVRFEVDGQQLVGVVNRITKRATVLVEDSDGERYSNGRSYVKYYVPLRMLQRVD